MKIKMSDMNKNKIYLRYREHTRKQAKMENKENLEAELDQMG